MSNKIAVVTINYNNSADTLRCVKSLCTSVVSAQIVIVDNASKWDSFSRLKEGLRRYQDVKLIRLDENIGFGRGNNVGMRWALKNTHCEFIFLLNNDAVIMPDTISRLVDVLDTYPYAGIAVPRIVMLEEPDTLWYGGGEVNWFKASGRVHGYLGPANAAYAMFAREVFFASGCAMIIRRSVIENIGGFDPRFFMYIEDMELSLRVTKAGWSIRYVPESMVMHKGQGSQVKSKVANFLPIEHPKNPNLSFFVYHMTKNRLLTVSAHAKGADALRFWCFFPLYWMAKCIQFVLYGRFDALIQTVKGVRDFMKVRNEPFVNELR